MASVISKFKEEVEPCALDVSEIADDRDCSDLSDLNIARKDKFILVIDLPICFNVIRQKEACAKDCKYIQENRLQMNVFGNVVPTINIPKLEKPFNGQVLTWSSHSRPAYESVTVNFTVDAGYNNYYVIYKWLDIMNDELESQFDAKNALGKNISGKQPNYTARMVLFALDEYNKKVARWDFIGAFPTSLGSITYSKRDPEELECSFTFDFSFLKMGLTDATTIL